MSSYNLIPFTDLTATGFTNAVVTTSFTVNSFTVADSTGADANRFISLTGSTTATPSFTFARDQRAGLAYRTNTTGTDLYIQGTIVSSLRYNNGNVSGQVALSPSVAIAPLSGRVFFATAPNFSSSTSIRVNSLMRQSGSGDRGLENPANSVAFTNSGVDTAIRSANVGYVVGTTMCGLWQCGTTLFGQYHSKPGLLQQATVTITPSTARSKSHVTNLLTAAGSTLFITLPVARAGLKYTLSNAQATAQTVVVNPVAADTLNVFGLTKATGASVAANAPFSSITFHCITSTMWLATKKTGTWT